LLDIHLGLGSQLKRHNNKTQMENSFGIKTIVGMTNSTTTADTTASL
jgi:hypothetical protein